LCFLKQKIQIFLKNGKLIENYVYMETDAAELLSNLKVKIIGIDYLSVDAIDSEELPVHHNFLSKGILIVENLELSQIEEGIYQFFVIPLNIPEMDGLPVRVLASRI